MTKRLKEISSKRKREIAGWGLILFVTSGLVVQLFVNILFVDKTNVIIVHANPKEKSYIYAGEETSSIDIKPIENESVEKDEEVNIVEENETQISSNAIQEESKATETEHKEKAEEINEKDLYWLSHVIMAEEEGACYENKLMCGLVVMNRVNDCDYPDTIEEVIFQKNQKVDPQYACIIATKTKEARIYLEPNEDSMKAAKEILSGNCSITIPKNVVYQSERELGSGLYKKIENQYYSYK